MALKGVERIFYAKVIKDDAAGLIFDKPKYLPGVQNITIKPKQNTEKLYGENKVWEQDTVLDSADVDLELAEMTNANLADLLGHKIDANGGIIANSSDEAPYIALLIEANKSKGEIRYMIIYKGKLGLPDDTAKGQEGKPQYQTPKLSGTFQPLQFNGDWKYQIDTDDPNCPEDIDERFFNAVITSVADNVAPIVTNSPLDGDSGVVPSANIVFTFDKAIQTDVITNANIFLMKIDGSIIESELTLSDDYKVVTLNPKENMASGSYVAICTKNIKSVHGVPIETSKVINFTV